MKINVSFSYTANLGNYESMKINLGMERDLDKDEDFEEAFEKEFESIQDLVLDKIDKLEQEFKE